MSKLVRVATRSLLVAATAASVAACGSNNDEPYKPAPAYSGRKADVPAVPTLASKPIKQGDAYTVWGVQHHLHSRVHAAEVNGKELSIVGYVVKTNLMDAPLCAVHKTGKADEKDCEGKVVPIPTFWIADEKGDEKNAIRVMGWASNYAQVFDAISKYGDGKKEVKELVKDEFWGNDVPNPLPSVGAKVQVTGTYGTSFSKSTSGVQTDPVHGILTFQKLNYLEPPTELAKLPGMKK